MSKLPKDLIILEMANNHMGCVEHGKRIIKEFSVLMDEFPEFSFAFKLQYRNLDTFIRPDFVGRTDVKHVKRFEETRLSRHEQRALVDSIKSHGYLTMCTPFDNESVVTIQDDGFDIIKIASCSFGDWPLVEDVAKAGLPIIASTAGADLSTIDNTILFFQNRGLEFIIQHCVGEYPTPLLNMNLNQIDYLKDRHPEVRFGFSTHEDPSDTRLVQMAVAKGAVSFEKHVGIPTEEFSLNLYSSDLEQTRAWLAAARDAKLACGELTARYKPTDEERNSLLALQRGAFLKAGIKKGQNITLGDVFFAFPPSEGQITAANFSKYDEIVAIEDLEQGQEIRPENVCVTNTKQQLMDVATEVMSLVDRSGVIVPQKFELEISHHYGLEHFRDYGLSMITLVNREYCKKILICLPNQKHPEQYHKLKEETFNVLYGELELRLDGRPYNLKVGDVVTVLPEQRHEFVSYDGAVLEEISSTHHVDDSYYTDAKISANYNRKSIVKWVR